MGRVGGERKRGEGEQHSALPSMEPPLHGPSEGFNLYVSDSLRGCHLTGWAPVPSARSSPALRPRAAWPRDELVEAHEQIASGGRRGCGCL